MLTGSYTRIGEEPLEALEVYLSDPEIRTNDELQLED